MDYTAGRYRIDPQLVEVDLWRSRRALEEAARAPDTAQRRRALATAAGLYRGELAAGGAADWLEPARETLRRQAVDALALLADLDEQAGDLDAALAALDQAIGHDPYAEPLYRRIMRLQARLGRPDAVQRTLRLLETRLAELDTEPEPDTRRLAADLHHPRPAPHPERDPHRHIAGPSVPPAGRPAAARTGSGRRPAGPDRAATEA